MCIPLLSVGSLVPGYVYTQVSPLLEGTDLYYNVLKFTQKIVQNYWIPLLLTPC